MLFRSSQTGHIEAYLAHAQTVVDAHFLGAVHHRSCLLYTSVSFEVFADDVETMEVEAREIATWAENVYVKIPCVTTKGESTAELVRKLSADGIKVNVTTIFTPTQVDEMVEAVDAETPSIISLFAGRIADTGVDPIPFMTESVKKAAAKPNCEVLWASTRELINIYQAEACGCQIITVPNSILAKRKNIGRDPYEVSLDTCLLYTSRCV